MNSLRWCRAAATAAGADTHSAAPRACGVSASLFGHQTTQPADINEKTRPKQVGFHEKLTPPSVTGLKIYESSQKTPQAIDFRLGRPKLAKSISNARATRVPPRKIAPRKLTVGLFLSFLVRPFPISQCILGMFLFISLFC